jgi:hypothetical protein
MALALQKVLAVSAVLNHATALMPLRERARLLKSDLFTPLLQYVAPHIREEIITYATRVLDLPVHPWLAEAERFNIVVARQTMWGKSTPTMGLSSSPSDEGLWDEIMAWHSARNSGKGTDLRDMLLDTSPDSLLLGFYSQARELFEFRDMLAQDLLSQATGTLSLGKVGAAPALHLHGDSVVPVVMSGYAANVAITDIVTVLAAPRWPLLTAEGDSGPLSGSAQAYEYNAQLWAEGARSQITALSALGRPDVLPPIYVEPQRPDVPTGFGLEILTPQMIRPMNKDEYFGDEDATRTMYTPEAIALWLGYRSADDMRDNVDMKALSHLLTWDAGSKAWRKPPELSGVTMVFKSSRTTQPWRSKVELPVAMPTATLALDYRTAPAVGPIAAVMIRTLELPVLVQGTFDAADYLAKTALNGLGFGNT